MREGDSQGVAEVIVVDQETKTLEGGLDRRQSDGGVGIK
jgi:hypothetical protein